MASGMKIAAIIALSLVLLFIGSRVYVFTVQGWQLNANLAEIQSRLDKAKVDQAALDADSKFLANPVNLEKELRARFNYKKPGETMIIIVPGPTSTTSTD